MTQFLLYNLTHLQYFYSPYWVIVRKNANISFFPKVLLSYYFPPKYTVSIEFTECYILMVCKYVQLLS